MKIELAIKGHTARIEPARSEAHTNGVDTSVPHDSLSDYIDQLERRLGEVYRLADDARGHVDRAFCPGVFHELGCPRCEAHKKLTKILKLSDLTRRDVIITQ